MGTRRVRRRLKREVRVAAFAIMFASPMSWALLTFVNFESKAPESVALASVVAIPEATPDPESETGPGVTISLEPSAIAYPANLSVEHPIVVPAGYLVPDHGPGDEAHEGD